MRDSALAMFGVGVAPGWMERAAAAEASQGKKVLVAIFLRGAADGLSLVAPYGDRGYAAARPNLALEREKCLDLDGFFGLHPNLKTLHEMFAEKKLAIVQAAGSPDATRSHFDAQDYMESGTPGLKSTRDGWMNRALPSGQKASPLRAVSMGPVLSRSLRGGEPAVALNSVRDFAVKDEMAGAEYMARYEASVDTELKGTGKDTFAAIRLMESLRKTQYQAENGAVYPRGKLGASLQQIAQMIKSDVGLELAFADMGGWDTHVNQANLLGNLAREMGEALGAFHQDMGSRMDGVTVVTMSEFGRTVRENGTRGTDHGHANAMFAFGGGVRGGKVYGDWPGLERELLYEGRDLRVTTDFREVLGAAVHSHDGRADLARVFPGYRYEGKMGAVFG
jgi:uncharacterized protein (DUF1501 family)